MQKKKVIAVIPARNEQEHIRDVLRETKKHVDKVIVVDDASSDKTGEIAKQGGALVLRHIVNLGAGGALKTGCDAALLLGADIIVILDADDQHDPREIPGLIDPILKGEADIVFGERQFNKNMPLEKRIGNKFFYLTSKYLFGTNIKDTLCGFRALTSEAYKKIRWDSRDYSVMSEILVNVKQNNLKYISKPIKTIYHNKYKGTSLIDGLKIFIKLIILKFRGKNGVCN